MARSLKEILGFVKSPRQKLDDALLDHDLDAALTIVSAHPDLRQDRDKKTGRTVLSEAAMNGLTDEVKWLLDHDFEPNVRDADGVFPIHSATTLFSHEIIQALLAAEADPNALDADNQTALHWAADLGATACCQALIDGGTIVTLRNAHGETALDLVDPSLDDGSCAAIIQAALDAAKAK